MHDTNEHYSDERQSHDTRMEYVRKKWTALHIHTYDVVTKQKALQQIRNTARHHMEGAINITLPS
jgi:hypothetical protein